MCCFYCAKNEVYCANSGLYCANNEEFQRRLKRKTVSAQKSPVGVGSVVQSNPSDRSVIFSQRCKVARLDFNLIWSCGEVAFQIYWMINATAHKHCGASARAFCRTAQTYFCKRSQLICPQASFSVFSSVVSLELFFLQVSLELNSLSPSPCKISVLFLVLHGGIPNDAGTPNLQSKEVRSRFFVIPRAPNALGSVQCSL